MAATSSAGDGGTKQAAFENDFNALELLFRATQEIEHRALIAADKRKEANEAQRALENAKDFRDRLVARINGYTADRLSENAQQSMFTVGFANLPFEEWRKHFVLDAATGEVREKSDLDNNDHEQDGA